MFRAASVQDDRRAIRRLSFAARPGCVLPAAVMSVDYGLQLPGEPVLLPESDNRSCLHIQSNLFLEPKHLALHRHLELCRAQVQPRPLREAARLHLAVTSHNNTPATQATRHVASNPPIIALNASREISARRSGASPE